MNVSVERAPLSAYRVLHAHGMAFTHIILSLAIKHTRIDVLQLAHTTGTNLTPSLLQYAFDHQHYAVIAWALRTQPSSFNQKLLRRMIRYLSDTNIDDFVSDLEVPVRDLLDEVPLKRKQNEPSDERESETKKQKQQPASISPHTITHRSELADT